MTSSCEAPISKPSTWYGDSELAFALSAEALWALFEERRNFCLLVVLKVLVFHHLRVLFVPMIQ